MSGIQVVPADRSQVYAVPMITHDRRGNPIFHEDFEGNLGSVSLDAVRANGGYCEQISSSCKNGSHCLQMYAGSVAGNTSEVYRRQAFQNLSKHGFEISFTYPGTGLDNYLFTAYMADWTEITYWRIKIVIAALGFDHTIQYLDQTGAYQSLATDVNMLSHDTYFNTFKLVFNLRNAHYERLILNNREWDMSALMGQRTTAADAPHLYIGLEAEDSVIEVDDFIITDREPDN